ncbi:MarR family winged helix-turn-helix transcriptional regulator [Ekhidna sp.]|uniref:MarR family winged helix-turn-helix transcriptional regulator n=1 Tax=Ekhidna sp. TaxID=2608089 RepID=UPI003B5061D0
MREDFLVSMGYPGLTARLKRLSDQLIYQTREIYKDHQIDIEPNWQNLFLLFKKHETLTVTQITLVTDLSHPAVIKIVNRMIDKGYLSTESDSSDARKKILQLTDKAHKNLPVFESFWQAGHEAIEELLNHETKLLDDLTIIENNIRKSNFRDRVNKRLSNKNTN